MSDRSTGRVAHPISVIVLAARELERSRAFYHQVFGWRTTQLSETIAVFFAPTGPSIVLRRYDREGEPSAVPMLQVTDVDEALAAVEAGGGRRITSPYEVPLGGRVIRFSDPSGATYGLTSNTPPHAEPQVQLPVGTNPRPARGTVCSLEMHASDLDATAHFFRTTFGWGTIATLPSYIAFDPAAGISGTWQSHSPSTPALPYLYVADVRQTLGEVAMAGGLTPAPPTELPGVATFGYCVDPAGTPLGLMGR